MTIKLCQTLSASFKVASKNVESPNENDSSTAQNVSWNAAIGLISINYYI